MESCEKYHASDVITVEAKTLGDEWNSFLPSVIEIRKPRIYSSTTTRSVWYLSTHTSHLWQTLHTILRQLLACEWDMKNIQVVGKSLWIDKWIFVWTNIMWNWNMRKWCLTRRLHWHWVCSMDLCRLEVAMSLQMQCKKLPWKVVTEWDVLSEIRKLKLSAASGAAK